MRTAALVLSCLLLAACGDPHKLLAGDVAYGPDTAQRMDVWEPLGSAQGESRPVIIAVHGGAWMGGDKAWGEGVAEQYTRYGYVVVSVNYRLAPQHRWPAQIEDCQAAMNYVRSQASAWSVDPDRVGAFGVSAGGHLAAMMALRPNAHGDQAACAVTANGEGDLTVYGQEPIMANEDEILTAVLGEGFTSTQLTDLSPTTYVVPGSRPVWVVHSTEDNNVFFDQGRRLAEALGSRGVPSGFTVVGDDSHGKTWEDEEALQDARAFFHAHIRKRE